MSKHNPKADNLSKEIDISKQTTDKQREIVLHQPDSSHKMEVLVENETVWLTQAQMTELFQTTKQNISLHINNVFSEGEVNPDSTVKEYLTVQYEVLSASQQLCH